MEINKNETAGTVYISNSQGLEIDCTWKLENSCENGIGKGKSFSFEYFDTVIFKSLFDELWPKNFRYFRIMDMCLTVKIFIGKYSMTPIFHHIESISASKKKRRSGWMQDNHASALSDVYKEKSIKKVIIKILLKIFKIKKKSLVFFNFYFY